MPIIEPLSPSRLNEIRTSLELSHIVYHDRGVELSDKNWNVCLTSDHFFDGRRDYQFPHLFGDLLGDRNNFYAEIYRNDLTKEIVVSFRGTDKLATWFTEDRRIATNQRLRWEKYAEAICAQAHKMRGQTGYRLSYTGHSAGGYIALLQALKDGVRCIAHESPSITPYQKKYYPDIPESNYANVLNVLGPKNVINSCQGPHKMETVHVAMPQLEEKLEDNSGLTPLLGIAGQQLYKAVKTTVDSHSIVNIRSEVEASVTQPLDSSLEEKNNVTDFVTVGSEVVSDNRHISLTEIPSSSPVMGSQSFPARPPIKDYSIENPFHQVSIDVKYDGSGSFTSVIEYTMPLTIQTGVIGVTVAAIAWVGFKLIDISKFKKYEKLNANIDDTQKDMQDVAGKLSRHTQTFEDLLKSDDIHAMEHFISSVDGEISFVNGKRTKELSARIHRLEEMRTGMFGIEEKFKDLLLAEYRNINQNYSVAESIHQKQRILIGINLYFKLGNEAEARKYALMLPQAEADVALHQIDTYFRFTEAVNSANKLHEKFIQSFDELKKIAIVRAETIDPLREDLIKLIVQYNQVMDKARDVKGMAPDFIETLKDKIGGLKNLLEVLDISQIAVEKQRISDQQETKLTGSAVERDAKVETQPAGMRSGGALTTVVSDTQEVTRSTSRPVFKIAIEDVEAYFFLAQVALADNDLRNAELYSSAILAVNKAHAGAQQIKQYVQYHQSRSQLFFYDVSMRMVLSFLDSLSKKDFVSVSSKKIISMVGQVVTLINNFVINDLRLQGEMFLLRAQLGINSDNVRLLARINKIDTRIGRLKSMNFLTAINIIHGALSLVSNLTDELLDNRSRFKLGLNKIRLATQLTLQVGDLCQSLRFCLHRPTPLNLLSSVLSAVNLAAFSCDAYEGLSNKRINNKFVNDARFFWYLMKSHPGMTRIEKVTGINSIIQLYPDMPSIFMRTELYKLIKPVILDVFKSVKLTKLNSALPPTLKWILPAIIAVYSLVEGGIIVHDVVKINKKYKKLQKHLENNELQLAHQVLLELLKISFLPAGFRQGLRDQEPHILFNKSIEEKDHDEAYKQLLKIKSQKASAAVPTDLSSNHLEFIRRSLLLRLSIPNPDEVFDLSLQDLRTVNASSLSEESMKILGLFCESYRQIYKRTADKFTRSTDSVERQLAEFLGLYESERIQEDATATMPRIKDAPALAMLLDDPHEREVTSQPTILRKFAQQQQKLITLIEQLSQQNPTDLGLAQMNVENHFNVNNFARVLRLIKERSDAGLEIDDSSKRIYLFTKSLEIQANMFVVDALTRFVMFFLPTDTVAYHSVNLLQDLWVAHHHFLLKQIEEIIPKFDGNQSVPRLLELLFLKPTKKNFWQEFTALDLLTILQLSHSIVGIMDANLRDPKAKWHLHQLQTVMYTVELSLTLSHMADTSMKSSGAVSFNLPYLAARSTYGLMGFYEDCVQRRIEWIPALVLKSLSQSLLDNKFFCWYSYVLLAKNISLMYPNLLLSLQVRMGFNVALKFSTMAIHVLGKKFIKDWITFFLANSAVKKTAGFLPVVGQLYIAGSVVFDGYKLYYLNQFVNAIFNAEELLSQKEYSLARKNLSELGAPSGYLDVYDYEHLKVYFSYCSLIRQLFFSKEHTTVFVNILNEKIDSYPNNGSYYHILALAELQLRDDLGASSAALKRALSLDPNNKEYRLTEFSIENFYLRRYMLLAEVFLQGLNKIMGYWGAQHKSHTMKHFLIRLGQYINFVIREIIIQIFSTEQQLRGLRYRHCQGVISGTELMAAENKAFSLEYSTWLRISNIVLNFLEEFVKKPSLQFGLHVMQIFPLLYYFGASLINLFQDLMEVGCIDTFFSMSMYYGFFYAFLLASRTLPIYQVLRNSQTSSTALTIYEGIANHMQQSRVVNLFSRYLSLHNFYYVFPDVFTILRQMPVLGLVFSLGDSIIDFFKLDALLFSSVISWISPASRLLISGYLFYSGYHVAKYIAAQKSSDRSQCDEVGEDHVDSAPKVHGLPRQQSSVGFGVRFFSSVSRMFDTTDADVLSSSCVIS
jgi:hypothetical protein